MSLTADVPAVTDLPGVLGVLAGWQHDDLPLQLHPGDIGWHLRLGPDATARSLRTWSRDGRLVAIALRESPSLLRLALAPRAQHDEDLTQMVVQDLGTQGSGALLANTASIELPSGVLADELLAAAGWETGEAFAPFQWDLTEPVPDPGLRVEIVGPELAAQRVQVHREAFGENSTFTEAKWHAVAAGPTYGDARCLLAFDTDGTPVAATTVWSAGPGRPGLIEPLGVSRAHHGRGHGTAITRAAAAVLRELGSSSAQVCTPADNRAAVAAYRAAGLTAQTLRVDRQRSV